MNHKTAFITASALTAFVLMLVGGITATVTSKALAMSPIAAVTLAATQAPTGVPSPAATKVKISSPQLSFLSPEQASKIALKLSPAAQLAQPPALVNYKGKMAYEVLLKEGKVYIDAFAGLVLYNGIGLAAAPATAVPAENGWGGGSNQAVSDPGPVVVPASAVMPPVKAHEHEDDKSEHHDDGQPKPSGGGGGEHDGGGD